MTEEQRQKRLKYVVIGLAGFAVLLAVLLVVLPSIRGGKESQEEKGTPFAEFKAAEQKRMQQGLAGTAPSAQATGTPSGGAPGVPAAAGGPAQTPGMGAAGAMAAQTQPATPPEDPYVILRTTNDPALQATAARMLQVALPGQQVVISPRVQVTPPKPKISFFDPSSGFGWGVALRGSRAAWNPPQVVAAWPQMTTPTTPSAPSPGAGPTMPMMGPGMPGGMMPGMGMVPGMSGAMMPGMGMKAAMMARGME